MKYLFAFVSFTKIIFFSNKDMEILNNNMYKKNISKMKKKDE